jgi:transposase
MIVACRSQEGISMGRKATTKQNREESEKPEYNVIPVQLSEAEFTEFILPHLSLPKRGPDCKIGYHRAFNLILKVLYTGCQWKEMPVDKDADGKAVIHYTVIYKLFARWCDDGSAEKAFVASVKHLADEQKLDLSLLHGDGSNTVAKKGATESVTAVTSTRKAKKSSPSQTTKVMSYRR